MLLVSTVIPRAGEAQRDKGGEQREREAEGHQPPKPHGALREHLNTLDQNCNTMRQHCNTMGQHNKTISQQ